MDILIIKSQWGEKILDGEKTWEIRGSDTKKRGRIALAFSKTGKKYGEADLTGSIELNEELWNTGLGKHFCEVSWDEVLKVYKHPYAWVFENPAWYEEPIPFTTRKGAVIWVKE